MFYPKTNETGLRVIDRLGVYYAFFTTQSNYIVVIYLFFSLFLKRFYNTLPAFGIELAVTVYISVTMLVFWAGLMSSANESGSYLLPHWISTFTLHLLIPIIMIFHFVTASGNVLVGFKEHFKFSFWAICAYPMAYLIFSLIRGEYQFQAYGPDEFARVFNFVDGHWVSEWKNAGLSIDTTPYSNQLWYPYWFMDIHNYTLQDSTGTIWIQHTGSTVFYISILTLACILITVLVTGFQFLFLWHNNKKYWRWHDFDKNILTKRERDYKVISRKMIKRGLATESKYNKDLKKIKYIDFIDSIKSMPEESKKIELQKYQHKIILDKKLLQANKKRLKLEAEISKHNFKEYLQSLPPDLRSKVKRDIYESNSIKKEMKKYNIAETDM